MSASIDRRADRRHQGLLRDEAWQRFSLGAFYKVNGAATGAPVVRNIYLPPQEGEPPDATVPALMLFLNRQAIPLYSSADLGWAIQQRRRELAG